MNRNPRPGPLSTLQTASLAAAAPPELRPWLSATEVDRQDPDWPVHRLWARDGAAEWLFPAVNIYPTDECQLRLTHPYNVECQIHRASPHGAPTPCREARCEYALPQGYDSLKAAWLAAARHAAESGSQPAL